MAFTFQKATKKQAKARVAISGPAGSGKSYTALRLATVMCKRVAAIDTEHGSLSKYADEFGFDVLQLSDFHPTNYVEAIKAAATAGYDGLVIDSASHEWNGPGGCLELVETMGKKTKGGNSWAAWADVTPLHNAFIEAIHQSNLHIFATFRSKMDYIQTENNGRKEIKKVGMAPITREGAEYEFDIVGEMDLEHNMVITKSRCKALADKVFKAPGDSLAKIIMNWLTDGAPADTSLPVGSAQSPKAPPPEPPTGDPADKPPVVHLDEKQIKYLLDKGAERGLDEAEMLAIGRNTADIDPFKKELKEYTPTEARHLYEAIKDRPVTAGVGR